MRRAITIIYFSPTGGCKKIAGAIGKALEGDLVTAVDLTSPQVRKEPEEINRPDCLIAVLPVYSQDLPDCIVDFLNGLKGEAIPAIIISVYGNIHGGRALYHAAEIMSTKGFKVLSAALCPAAHSYNNRYLTVAPGCPDSKALLLITRFVAVSLSKLKSEGCSYLDITALEKKKNIFAGLPQKLIGHLSIKKPDRNQSLCRHCNRCRAACPVAAITSTLEIDNKKCIRCGACVKACAQQARQIRFISPVPYLYLSRCGKKKPFLQFYH